MPSSILLLLLQAVSLTRAYRSNSDAETLNEWRAFIRIQTENSNSFRLAVGDSLDLDCRRSRHAERIPIPISLEWRLLDKPLSDEGSSGRIHLLDNDGRLTIENVNERDGGMYGAYMRAQALGMLLEESLLDKKESLIALCMFTVGILEFRNFTLREGDNFFLDTRAWLVPLADTITALSMTMEEWRLAWYLNGEEVIHCSQIDSCKLNFTASRSLTVGIWTLELRSLAEKSGQRRTLFSFSMSVRGQLTYLESFPLATHKYYMVYGSLMIAMFLLSLHLFNNLNWTPFAFDVLPDQVSPRAVLDQAGVFLKETRV